MFCVKAYIARIATRQDTINHELDEVEVTCGRAYVAWISYAATIDSDECPIGIFLLRPDLTHNHDVGKHFSSILRDILKSNDAEGVRALYMLVLGDL